MRKPTAVDYLYRASKKPNGIEWADWTHAKELEKSEIKTAYDIGLIWLDPQYNSEAGHKSAEDYYNETYEH